MKNILLCIILSGLLLSACGNAEVAAGGETGGTGTVPEADVQPPLFASGGMSALSVSGAALFVTWPEAADGVTDRLLLEYRLYYSTASNLTSVAAVTNNGTAAMVWTRNIQERLVTGLAPSNTYHFAVLVRDQAGNLALCSGVAAATGAAPGLVRTIQIAGQPVRFRYCPGGLAPMQSETVLSNIDPFWLGEIEVTYGLWHAVYTWATNNGFVFANPGQEGSGGTPGAAPTAASNQPAVNMSWRDALVWCNAASELSGLTLAYLSNASGPVVRRSTNRVGQVNGLDNAWTDPAGGIRFTTRWEWLCAARYRDGLEWTPGTAVSGAWGVSGAVSSNYAWYNVNSGGVSHETGLLLPNELGCHDMCGNCGEFFFSAGAYYEKLVSNWYTTACSITTYSGLSSYDKAAVYGFRIAITILP